MNCFDELRELKRWWYKEQSVHKALILFVFLVPFVPKHLLRIGGL